MDDIKTQAATDAEEMEQRRSYVRMADAENRLEGITRDPATDEIFNAYVRGDLKVTDIVPRLLAQLHR